MLDPLTIRRPIPFGYHHDGTPAEALLRDGCCAVVAAPGSGKTILLQNLLIGLLRCPDCLVWVIDLSRGGLTNPYVGPWRRGLVKHPGIDWVAPDVDEALGMVACANELITFRREYYEELMHNRSVDKLPVSHRIPAIEIVIDEGKTVTGLAANQRLIRGLIDVADKGRGMGVRIIISALRATAHAIPSELMADIEARIGMKVSSPAELNYLFDWAVKINPKDTLYPGCGLWRPSLSAGPPVPFRSHDLGDPQLIARLAAACARWRPTLDEPSRMEGLTPELRHLYDTRWERAGGPLASGRSSSSPLARSSSIERPGERSIERARERGRATEQATEQARSAEHRASSPRATERAGSKPLDSLAQSLDTTAVDAAFARAKRVLRAEAATAPGRLDATWEQIAETLDADRVAGGAGWRDDSTSADARGRMREILAAAGPDGLSGPKVRDQLAAAGHDVPMATVYRWLRLDATNAGYGSWTLPAAPDDEGQLS